MDALHVRAFAAGAWTAVGSGPWITEPAHVDRETQPHLLLMAGPLERRPWRPRPCARRARLPWRYGTSRRSAHTIVTRWQRPVPPTT
jgi:hypothetical protein